MVVAIIGILAAVAIPSYQKYVYRAKAADLLTHIDALRLESAAYATLNGWPLKLTHVAVSQIPQNLPGFPATSLAVDHFETVITNLTSKKTKIATSPLMDYRPVVIYRPAPNTQENKNILEAAYSLLPASVIAGYAKDDYLMVYLFASDHKVGVGPLSNTPSNANTKTPTKQPNAAVGNKQPKVVVTPKQLQFTPTCPADKITYHTQPNPNDPCAKPISDRPANYCPPSQYTYHTVPDPSDPCAKAIPASVMPASPPLTTQSTPSVAVSTPVPHLCPIPTSCEKTSGSESSGQGDCPASGTRMFSASSGFLYQTTVYPCPLIKGPQGASTSQPQQQNTQTSVCTQFTFSDNPDPNDPCAKLQPTMPINKTPTPVVQVVVAPPSIMPTQKAPPSIKNCSVPKSCLAAGGQQSSGQADCPTAGTIINALADNRGFFYQVSIDSCPSIVGPSVAVSQVPAGGSSQGAGGGKSPTVTAVNVSPPIICHTALPKHCTVGKGLNNPNCIAASGSWHHWTPKPGYRCTGGF